MRNQYIEYVWLDNGNGPEGKLIRSKTKIIRTEQPLQYFFESFEMAIPKWNFDGSSTGQAETHNSELFLKPIARYLDPFRRQEQGIVVLCEVLDESGPHTSNTRRKMIEAAEKYDYAKKTLFGYEQEYFILTENDELFGKKKLEDVKQGPYYCGNGANVTGRTIMDQHTEHCLYMKLLLSGTNFEVMYSQSEYQLGPVPAISGADDLWISRWVLNRVCEQHNAKAVFHPKPFNSEKYNGSGMHVNFSTEEMKHPSSTQKKMAVENIVERLKKNHQKHINVYGSCNEMRLTGKNETCDINTFKSGFGDRTASIRIPKNALLDNANTYIEDRRPASNADPYEIVEALLTTAFEK